MYDVQCKIILIVLAVRVLWIRPGLIQCIQEQYNYSPRKVNRVFLLGDHCSSIMQSSVVSYIQSTPFKKRMSSLSSDIGLKDFVVAE